MALLAIAVLASPHASAQENGTPLYGQGYSPPPAKEGHSYPDCYCTDSAGRRIEMGQTACLQIGSREVLARCEMSLNNPAWREQQQSCPGV